MKEDFKFKEGDIIIHDDSFYIAAIAGAEKTLFIKSEIGLFSIDEFGKYTSGIRQNHDIDSQLTLLSDKNEYFYRDKYKCKKSKYPVIGYKPNCGTALFKLYLIEDFYPEIYFKMIEKEYKRLTAPQEKETIKKTVKTTAKKATTKTTKK